MIAIDIAEEFHPLVDPQSLEMAAKTTLENATTPRGAAQEADLTIVIGDDAQIARLNREYRGVDAPTDVLSFPADFSDPENHTPYLGDIIISYPRALAQAEAGGHSTSAELQLLVVHGVLHLLGHDHAESEEKARMWQIQSQTLAELGLSAIQITE